MPVYLLNLFFRFSGYTFGLKQKIIHADNWFVIIPYFFVLIFSELGLIIISLPVYILVPPAKVQEDGFIFPKAIKEEPKIKAYALRRKITLSTIFGAGGIFLLKVLVVGLASLYLFGSQRLLADTQDWTLSTSGEYIYDISKIDIAGGVAQLKDLGGTTIGSSTNPGFTSVVTPWAYHDWLDNAKASGAYASSGGNPSGHVRITLNPNKNKTTAGYYEESFTTTVATPDIATLNLTWSSITYSSTNNPITYRLYAFIDTASGNPTGTSTAVWNSGEITSTTAWASSTPINLDIKSKIPIAGTYYLKIAAYVKTPDTNGTYNYISGFDNVSVNWSKTTHSYDSGSPTVTASSSLSVPKAVSWNSFTETATKNGGEIYYQMTTDNGVNWKFHNGSNWATTTSITEYNTATSVNAYITSIATSSNQIKWRAYLKSNGSQQAILDNIAIGYTQNQRPAVANLAPAQNTNYGYVHVNYNLQDAESDPSSLSTYEYSLTGVFGGEQTTMTASTTDPAHNGVTALTTAPAGVAHNFVWDAKSQLGNTYNANVYVRLRPNDGIGNGIYATSTSFAVDYATSTVSNIVPVQNLATTSVAISYDLFDNTADNILTEMQISGDGGASWTVATSTAVGAIGSGVTSGNGKTISWNAATNYPNIATSSMKVRIRAKDKFQNQGDYSSSTTFSLDTLPPAISTTTNLLAQPNAGDATVLLGGSFAETNPNTNDFYVAIDGGAYGTSTVGDVNTATPANKNTNIGATLDGNDYISKVKLVHVDDYGQATTNENTSPTVVNKYVKPYTPQAPTLNNPLTNRLDLQVNANVSEATDLQYAIYEETSAKYVQSDGTLGASAVWQVLGTASGQWGNGLGINGKVRITGLISPVSLYTFKVMSRNPSDGAHAISSQSAWSATAAILNTAPSIALNSYAQTTDGTQYTNINYTGTDGQGDINNIATYQYSTDNSTWHTMTEKSGAGSNGTSSLVFLPTSSSYKFVWNSGADLTNVEDSTVYTRLKANDTQTDGNTAVSSAFEIDNKLPTVSVTGVSQNSGAKTVAVNYTLTDANNSLVQIDISADGGSTWSVATSSLTGAVGTGVTPGSKSVTWNAGTNYNDQYNTNMKVRVRARDTYGNQGSYAESSNFTVDTHAPVLSNVTASQDTATSTFTFHYDLTEDIGSPTIALEISSDSGSTWTVATTSATGDLGSITPGINKTITWNAATNYNNQEKLIMKIRLTAVDSFSNSSNLSSANFSLDTKAPRITNVASSQTLASTTVLIHYDLADQNNSNILLNISADGGSTWNVASTSISGDFGSGISAGTNKTITWLAATDFPNQDLTTMKVRLRGMDVFSNQSAYASSSNFLLDTLPPAVNVGVNLLAQPLAGATSALIGGSFTETNPDSNNFYLAIDDGAYSLATVGTTNTSTPANQLTAVGASLDGNDYISKVKIIHTDDYGQSVTNENNSPASAYKYVKPYVPAVPTVNNPGIGTVDVLINKNAAETDGLEYAIYEATSTKYVQSNGTLGTSPVWQTLGTGAGQWGQTSGVSGKINVNGLTTHSYLYQFQIKSRNTSDAAHAATSESTLSSGASSANQSPVITIDYVGQSSNNKYVTINYTGSDLESETSHLVVYQYSTDNSTWHTMTEKSGVGSEGIAGLSFVYPGISHSFMWDVGTDINNIEDTTVYVRLKANDGTSDGGMATLSAFAVDTKNPVVSSVTASQTNGSNNVVIGYSLNDQSNSTIDLEISNDGGTSWTVATSTATGDLGTNVTPGSKTINWNPGVDFSGQEKNNIKVRIQATDNYGNQAGFISSANFTIDTKSPVFANFTASQNSGNNTVRINYDISDANTSNVALDISLDSGASWTVTDTSLTGDITSVASGTNKLITWNAGTDFSGQELSTMRIRIRATDSHNNATGNIQSADFSLDTKAPIITSVAAVQVLNSDTVSFAYNLADSGNAQIIMDVSADSGLTWTVATSTLFGDVGTNIIPGNNKSVTWNVATDYNNQQNATMKVRVRGIDAYNNVSSNVELSGLFSVDTLAPTINLVANLKSQPNAGDTTALIGGSFTEVNPKTNNFQIAINGGVYGTTTAGEINTASPADQNTAVGAILTGNDYISKVKISHLDNYAHSVVNENTSPTSTYKYVKPYTPQALTISNPQNTSVDLTINAHAGEAAEVEYAIYESSTGKYVQTNGSLATSTVWKTLGTASGQWGNLSGVTGKIIITGLVSPVANYSFVVKSRNPRDAAHAISSESSYSTVAAITNTAPSINITSASQNLSGSYVTINYTGTDAQNDTNNITAYEYSINGTTWQAMTEKTGVGSDGTSNLIFYSTGTPYTFAWDVSSDLLNQEQATVYVRLLSSDTLASSNLAASSAFYVDTKGPIISSVIISQTPSSNIVNFEYNLSDSASSNNNVTLEISSDNGSTYNVATTTLAGDIGSNITSGNGRTVTWNAATDFSNQESSIMKVRLRGTDRFGNLGAYAISDNFTLDTKNPVISGVTASQALGSGNVSINYTLSDSTSAGHLVEFSISNDSGSTWTVPTTTTSGEIGAGQTTGAKNFYWSASVDYAGHDISTMKARIRAKDYFSNQGAYASSSNFTVDTLAPTISSISATQAMSTTTIAIAYNLSETATTTLDISSDGGLTWTVNKTSLTGDLGSVASGSSKSISWKAGTDFNNQENSTTRVRLNGVDNYGNTSIYYESSNFAVDTATPLGLLSLNKYAASTSTVTLNWQATTDAHFNHYELWHGANLTDVNNHNGTALQWSTANDASLSNPLTVSTVITGISLTDNYYTKIWAIDNFGNTATVDAINVYAVCSDWTYSDWGTCSDLGQQTRTILTSSPSGCLGGSPILSQSCTPTCTAWTYSGWGTCSDLGQQTRTILTSSPSACAGGSPVLSQSCTPTCNAWTYSDWGTCSDLGQQTRTVTTSSPSGCAGGSPTLTQSCIPTCTAWTYSGWGTCSDLGQQTRTILTSTPSGCDGGSPILFQSCTPTCNAWTYSDWGTCSDLGQQTRTIVSSSPSACAGGSPTLSQSCTPTCSAWTYSDWGTCSDLGERTRTILTSTPGGCSGGIPIITEACTPTYTCSAWTYSDWGTCSDLGQQTRTVLTSSPSGCINGSPIISQSCVPTCSAWTYSGWGTCSDLGQQTRTILTSSPSGCDGGSSITSQSCTPTCSAWTYSDWGNCSDAGQQTRTILSSSPSSCAGGSPVTSQSCTPTCNTWTYSDWGDCSNLGEQTRTVLTSSPSSCTNGSPVTSQLCTTTCTSWTYSDWGTCSTNAQQTRSILTSSPTLCNGGDSITSQSCTPIVRAAGGAPVNMMDNIPPVKPILNPLITPTKETLINVYGLAEPRAKVDLYDNGVFIGTLKSLADNNGLFNEEFRFNEGNHSLTVKASDGANNSSQFSDSIILNIITSAPSVPIILTPKNNDNISEVTLKIVGVADANNQINIKVDDNQFAIESDNNGAWSFILPSSFSFTDGQHNIAAFAKDGAGNESPVVSIIITKISIVTPIQTPLIIPSITPAETAPSITSPVTVTPTIPSPVSGNISLPSTVLISDATNATELAGIPVPKVITTGAEVQTTGDVFTFTGTSLPNFDVIVYIHSNQALVYRTRTDQNGNWVINHSQATSELTPGEHTIYAVALDADAKVKSRPSAVSSFTVERNIWVMIYNNLDWRTTLVTLVILILSILWLYHIRKKRKA